jgi:ribose 5-phosphate isomerase B
MSTSARVAVGADHRGSEAARAIAESLRRAGHEVTLFESNPDTPCDYPEQAWKVGRAIHDGSADRGVLICGTGIGMSMAANKIDGVRAAVVHDEMTSQLSRAHNDANVLCLSADLLGERLMDKLVQVFMTTEFEGGRHARRVNKIGAIERDTDPSVGPSAGQPC